MATPPLGWINTRRERDIYRLPLVDKNRGTQRAGVSFLPSFLPSFPLLSLASSYPIVAGFCHFTHGSKRKDLSATRGKKKGGFHKRASDDCLPWKIGFLLRSKRPPPLPPSFSRDINIRISRNPRNVYCDENQDFFFRDYIVIAKNIISYYYCYFFSSNKKF